MNGLLFFGNRIIIPTSMRTDILQVLHEGHFGMVKCKSRAREVIFWPGLSADIENMIARCPSCLQYSVTNQKETLHPHAIPSRPWQVLGSDIMTLNGRDYLVVVDYFSKYPEFALLENKTAGAVILHLKSIFARHGIPEKLVGDNMPYDSAEVRQFARDWGFTISTSSPEHAQSNGQSERTVQTLKKMLKKSPDPYISLLQYRNAPIIGLSASPAQLLMSRMLRDKLPAHSRLLKPKISHARNQLKQRQARQKDIFDRNAKDLPELKQNDHVYVQRGKEWRPATVTGLASEPRSYFIQCDGRQLRRNRRWLRKVRDLKPKNTPKANPVPSTPKSDLENHDPDPNIEETDNESHVNPHGNDPAAQEQGRAEQPNIKHHTTQRGRAIKIPNTLKDYVLC